MRVGGTTRLGRVSVFPIGWFEIQHSDRVLGKAPAPPVSAFAAEVRLRYLGKANGGSVRQSLDPIG